MVISYEFLSVENQATEKTLRGDPGVGGSPPAKGPEWVAKTHTTASSLVAVNRCCRQQQLAKKGNAIQPLICLTSFSKNRLQGKLFQSCTGRWRRRNGGSCGLWQLEVSERKLWGVRGVGLGSGGDLKPESRSQGWRQGEGSSSRREFLNCRRERVSTVRERGHRRGGGKGKENRVSFPVPSARVWIVHAGWTETYCFKEM